MKYDPSRFEPSILKVELRKPNYNVTIGNEDGTSEKLEIGENGELLYNGKELNGLDDANKAIKLLLKAVCTFVSG